MANTAFTHDPTITVPSSTVNNRVVTWNGTTGKVFNNTATVTIAAGVVAGVTALTVDNLTIDGNTIISTDTNGNITLTPDGTGSVVMDTMTFNGNLLDVRNNGTASAIRLYCENSNAHYQEIKAAPHGVAATYSIILPGAAPTAAGKVLKSSGSSPFSTLAWGNEDINIQMVVVDFATALTLGDGKFYFYVPATLNTFELIAVHGEVVTASAGADIRVQLHNVKSSSPYDMLTGNGLVIAATKNGSDETGGSVTIDTSSNRDVLTTHDIIRVDINQVGSSTAGSGLVVNLTCRLP